MPPTAVAATAQEPIRSPLIVILISWLVPGAGHFMLGKRGRAGLIFASVLLSFFLGVLMRGPLFQPSGGADVLSKLIQYGGFLGDLAAGIPYFIVSFFGYAPADLAGHVADYGSKLIVAAGLLNILAIVDAYEITTRQKD
jgi:uncharacterized protein DUF6677